VEVVTWLVTKGHSDPRYERNKAYDAVCDVRRRAGLLMRAMSSIVRCRVVDWR
jgi:hypothetical protein